MLWARRGRSGNMQNCVAGVGRGVDLGIGVVIWAQRAVRGEVWL